jgi:hypothetical protein
VSTNSAIRDLAEALADVVEEEEPQFHPLFYVGDSPGVTTCLRVITGDRGISRCYLWAVLPGSDRCGVGSHKTKAAVVACTWLLAVQIRGNLLAGLVGKMVKRKDILEEDSEIFDNESHPPVEWIGRF